MLKIYQHSLVALVPFVKPTLQTFALLFLELGPFEIALRCTNDKMPFSKSTDPTTDWLLGEWLEGEWIQLRNSINSQSRVSESESESESEPASGRPGARDPATVTVITSNLTQARKRLTRKLEFRAGVTGTMALHSSILLIR